MVKYVIDTNVPIVANGLGGNVSINCRLASVELLQLAISKGNILLDSDGVIQREYHRNLNPRGQPGVGNRFYLEILNSNPNRVTRVDLALRADGQYVDLPQPIIDANFDPSDRVFAALAHKMKAKVYNAVDTDWLENREVIESNGIKIEFICGCVPGEWRTTPNSN